MPFFIVDDGFSSHPKVTGLKRGATRERAAGLWVLAGSWSARYLTEGRIPYEQVDELGCSHVAARWLVEHGLWERTDDGYAFHDWTGNGNPSRDQVLERRSKRAEAGAKGGKASGETRRGRSKPEANAEADLKQVLHRNDAENGHGKVTAALSTGLEMITVARIAPENTGPGIEYPQVSGKISEANASTIVEPQVPSTKYQVPSQTKTPVVALVCRRLFGDAKRSLSDDDRRDLWQLWGETAGQSVDLEAELMAWLMHNTTTDLRNPGAALLGWLRTAARRAGNTAPGCDQCIRGWAPDEFGQPSEHRCTACRPHLRAVDAS